MTDFRAPRRQAAETDYWWPEPESAQLPARAQQPEAPDRRPPIMQQRREAPFHQEPPSGRGGQQQAASAVPGGRSRTESDSGSYRMPSYPAQADPGRNRPPSAAGPSSSSGTSRSKRSSATGGGAGSRFRPSQGAGLSLAGTSPLTTFGVSAVLAGACVLGGLLDLLLVSTAAWAITGLFLAASVYAAMKVHRSHWYSAVVGPPLAFAAGLLFVAQFSPERTGPGFMGTVTTILALLAIKARAAFAGTALGLGIVLARRLPFSRGR